MYVLDGGTASDLTAATEGADKIVDALVLALGTTQAYTTVFAQQPAFKPFISTLIEARETVAADPS